MGREPPPQLRSTPRAAATPASPLWGLGIRPKRGAEGFARLKRLRQIAFGNRVPRMVWVRGARLACSAAGGRDALPPFPPQPPARSHRRELCTGGATCSTGVYGSALHPELHPRGPSTDAHHHREVQRGGRVVSRQQTCTGGK
jgi:hypothetical protein